LRTTFDWMLQTLQCHFAAHCSPNYITHCYVNDTTTCPTCRVSSWKLTPLALSVSQKLRPKVIWPRYFLTVTIKLSY